MDLATPRIATLDGLRGIAVMGILLMNVNAFAMPFPAYDDPAAYGTPGPLGIALWAIELVLVDGKMRAIFSALFGASLLLVTDRAEAAGRDPARVHYARMATLLLFGLAHACLVWDGDILVLYALTGMVAFPLRKLPVERLLVLAGLIAALGAGSLALHYQALAALGHAASLPGARPADVATWRAVLDQIGRPRPTALFDDLQVHRGQWAPLAAKLTAAEWGSIIQQLLLDGPETLGLMLFGMAGLRSGFLAGAWRAKTYRRIARWLLAGCVPPMIAIGLYLVARGFPPLATSILTDLAAMPFRWGIATAEAALAVAWLARAPSPIRARITAAGRCAFTNYLGTSLVMTALFDGWGFGLYGHLPRIVLLPIVFATWALMLGWSRPWLNRFAYGPFEWTWRLLARGNLPRIRRT